MKPAVLIKFGLPFLIRVVSAGLERIDHPGAKSAAKAVLDVGTALGDRVQAAVDATPGPEAAPGGSPARRARPITACVVALTWVLQLAALVSLIVADPDNAGRVIDQIASLARIWEAGIGPQ